MLGAIKNKIHSLPYFSSTKLQDEKRKEMIKIAALVAVLAPLIVFGVNRYKQDLFMKQVGYNIVYWPKDTLRWWKELYNNGLWRTVNGEYAKKIHHLGNTYTAYYKDYTWYNLFINKILWITGLYSPCPCSR